MELPNAPVCWALRTHCHVSHLSFWHTNTTRYTVVLTVAWILLRELYLQAKPRFRILESSLNDCPFSLGGFHARSQDLTVVPDGTHLSWLWNTGELWRCGQDGNNTSQLTSSSSIKESHLTFTELPTFWCTQNINDNSIRITLFCICMIFTSSKHFQVVILICTCYFIGFHRHFRRSVK